MADIFGRQQLQQKTPITADRSTLLWQGTALSSAINLSIQYSQQVTRRRSIGTQFSVIYGSQPQGTLTIARMLTTEAESIFGTPAWNGCAGGSVTFTLKGACLGNAGGGGTTYTANGCIVSSYSVQASADDLTVVDNITVEFLELIRQ